MHPSEYKQIYEIINPLKSILSTHLDNYQHLLKTKKWLKSLKKWLKINFINFIYVLIRVKMHIGLKWIY